MRSFDEFRLAVMDDVSATVKKTSGTPPPHFLVEDAVGDLGFVGPIWHDQAEKQNAPTVMRTWIRKQRPEQLAFVMEAFSVESPTNADLSIPPSEHTRRRHKVNAWFFRRGLRESEAWEADVLKDDQGRIHLGEWRSLDPDKFRWSGELFDPVLDAMSDKTSAWRRLLG